MDTTIIEKRICLDSKFLDSNYEQHILNKANQDTKNECSQKYGFIIRIVKIVDIIDHEINRVNADNVFTYNPSNGTFLCTSGARCSDLTN